MGGFGGGMGGMGGGASRSAMPEGPAIRTIYIVDREKSQPGKMLLSAVSVKTGISDTIRVKGRLEPVEVFEIVDVE